MVNAQLFLAQILNLEGQYDAASKLYDQIDVWTAKWEPSRREADQRRSGARRRHAVAGQQRQRARNRPADLRARTPEIRRQELQYRVVARLSTRSRSRARARRRNALQAFKESLPVLLSSSGGGDDDSGTTAAAREGPSPVRDRRLSAAAQPQSVDSHSASVVEETFGYADVLRGQSVQRALQASSARSATKNPVLAKLVRASQDTEKQIGAAVATLNNLLALPPSERDEKAVTARRRRSPRLQATRRRR